MSLLLNADQFPPKRPERRVSSEGAGAVPEAAPICCGECNYFVPTFSNNGNCDAPVPACVETYCKWMMSCEGAGCPCFERKAK